MDGYTPICTADTVSVVQHSSLARNEGEWVGGFSRRESSSKRNVAVFGLPRCSLTRTQGDGICGFVHQM